MFDVKSSNCKKYAMSFSALVKKCTVACKKPCEEAQRTRIEKGNADLKTKENFKKLQKHIHDLQFCYV